MDYQKNQDVFEKFSRLPKSALYCVQPVAYSTRFKLGKSKNIGTRLDSYCHAWPTGYKVYAILEVPKNMVDKAERTLFNVAATYGYVRAPAECGGRTKDTEWVMRAEGVDFQALKRVFTDTANELGNRKGVKLSTFF